MNTSEAKSLIAFLHEAEKLKTLLRHSWLSSRRRESVAEHSWRMALMAILLEPYLNKKVDLLKTLKMILIHDLVEVNYADYPAFKKQPLDKSEQERLSLRKLTKSLPKRESDELLSLWEEYEEAESNEALFARFLDKAEVLLQHGEADAKYMTRKEISFNLYYGKEFAEHDEFLKEFRGLINEEFLKQYKKYKIDKNLYQDYI